MLARQIAVIGGMDPTGGAGLLRDAWTLERRRPELELHAVCTALTRQGEGRPARIAAAPAHTLTRELERVAALPRLRAIKLGMIPTEHVDVIARLLAQVGARERAERPWVVLDPVGFASAGGRLGADPAALLRLAEHVDLLTPNLAELAELRAAGPLPHATAILHKGEPVPGHPERIRDRLCIGEGERVFERARVPGPDPRGTGCALACAIACELAAGRSLVDAVQTSVAWLDDARRDPIRAADGWHLRGPLRGESPRG